jgi:hypothetical protein
LPNFSQYLNVVPSFVDDFLDAATGVTGPSPSSDHMQFVGGDGVVQQQQPEQQQFQQQQQETDDSKK